MFQAYARSILGKYDGSRLLSVDAMRGLTIFAMILVNNPGTWERVYPPLRHAEWHGWTPTDLVFPFFLFIVGVSIALSLGNVSANTACYRRIALRSAKLFALGLLLALFYYDFYHADYSWVGERLSRIRVMGVLQRIALVYGVCAVLYLHLGRGARVVATVIFLAGYWALMLALPYSGADGAVYRGGLQPGNNLAAWLDQLLFGARHLYHRDTVPFASDPEGLLSTLPALASCLVGTLTGDAIRSSRGSVWLWRQLSIFGVLMLGLAVLSSQWIPINKNLWTPSYVLLSSGLALWLLGACVFLLDQQRWRGWSAPFVVFGSNAIALYMLSGVVVRLLLMIRIDGNSIQGWLYSGLTILSDCAELTSLLYAVLFMAAMYLPMHLMYRHGIFWKV